jgi:excisionase family DNA binding protein
VDTPTLLAQIANGNVIALVPNPRAPEPVPKDTGVLGKRWYTMREVADMLGFGLCKVKALVLTGELRSIKDGKYRRILPEWVDEYVARRVEEAGP